jgi:two-component system, chemotaxis family, chemotaxis protein CheY
MARILSVDDSNSVRQMVAFALKSAGHEVEQAEDGVEAFSKASSGQFDLILSDVNMPNMNGLELTKKLRETEQYKFTPIILLTTESGSDMKSQGKEVGATGWIVKPFNPEKLLATIQKVVS